MTVRGADDDQSFLSTSCQIIEGEGLEAEHTRTHGSDDVRHVVVTSGEGGTLGIGPLIDPTDAFNNAAQATRAFVESQQHLQIPQYWDGTYASDTPSPTNATLYQFSLVT